MREAPRITFALRRLDDRADDKATEFLPGDLAGFAYHCQPFLFVQQTLLALSSLSDQVRCEEIAGRVP
jgi:hypothetical protein